ncbi:MAG: carboxypeptidase-like regulatory domain-containing protein [Terriglobia bacterium]
MRISRVTALTVVTLAALSAGIIPTAPRAGLTSGSLIGPAIAEAQNFGDRTVTGAVLDAGSKPVSGATVFLENEKTKTIRSYVSDAQGHFNFAQVDMTQDFNLWAEKGKKKSATRVVSSWDARKQWVGDLKLK